MICANVCSMFYFKVISPTRSRVRVLRIEPALDFPLFCRNCEDAPCIKACPEGALSRTSKGIVIVNNGKCSGTGACVKACPYQAIQINPDTSKAFKCIQCGQCVDRCPADALFMTTNNDLAKRDEDGRLLRLYEKYKENLYGKEEF
jgi:carbon-monoxide dehydrogenase iron sulfur subunit